MANAGWEDTYLDGSNHITAYADGRTIRVRRLLALSHFQPLGQYDEAWAMTWNTYLQGEDYVPIGAQVWQSLGFPAVEVWLPFGFAAHLLSNQYNYDHTPWLALPQDPNIRSYVLFGRTAQGIAQEIASTRKDLDLAAALDGLATALDRELCGWFQFTNGIGNFRTIDTKDLTLLIEPVEDGTNGVSFALVRHAFEQVYAAIKPKTNYIFERQQDCHYTQLYMNPFYHYQTSIPTADISKFIGNDRGHPTATEMRQEQFAKWAEDCFKYAKENNLGSVGAFMMEKSPEFLAWIRYRWTSQAPINCDNMEAAIGTRSQQATQKVVMGGVSASDVAFECKGPWFWDAKPRPEFAISPAEWLHVIAYSFGGLSDNGNPADSQLAENMIFGSAECNSHMFRYEKGWQMLLTYEKILRELVDDQTVTKGTIDIRRNGKNKQVRSLFSPWWTITGNIEVDGREKMAHKYPWLCYVMEYTVRLEGYCRLFRSDNVMQATEFFPFSRHCTTRTESVVDNYLLDGLFYKEKSLAEHNRRMAAQQAALNTVVFGNALGTSFDAIVSGPPQFSLEMHTASLVADGADSLEAEPEPVLGAINGTSGNPEAAAANGLKRRFTADEEEDAAASRPAKMAHNPDNPVTTIRSLEAGLVASADFDRLEASDLLLDLAAAVSAPALSPAYEIALDQVNGIAARESTPAELAMLFDSGVATTHAPELRMSASYNSIAPAPALEPLSPAVQPVRPPVLVGGAEVTNVALVLTAADNSTRELPVAVAALSVDESQGGLLLVPTNALEVPQPPILLLPSAAVAEPVAGSEIASAPAGLATISEVKTLARETFNATTSTVNLDAFAYTADITSLFGVPGLAGKLSVFKDATGSGPLMEKVVPVLDDTASGIFGGLFPNISNDIMKHIPLRDVALVYLENETDMFHHAGLRLEAKLAFEGVLQPVADTLQHLAGPDNKAPQALSVAADLSRTRNWGARPALCSVVLQGALTDMSWKLWDVLDFRTVGVEVSTTKVATIGDDNCWSFGYGFFGEVHVCDIFGPAPLELKYRMNKTGDLLALLMSFQSDLWKDACGVKGFDLNNISFQTTFKAEAIKDTFTCQVSAQGRLGGINLTLRGFFGKKTYQLAAHVGNLKWADIAAIYHQVMGTPLSVDMHGNDLTFEDLSLQISNTGVEFYGKVTFNGRSSASGYLRLGTDGLAIGGAITDYKVGDTDITIKEAALDIFIAVNRSSSGSKTAKPTQFAIRGMVEFESSSVECGLMLSKKKESDLQWLVYGSLTNIKLSRFVPELDGGDFDIHLKKMAILASNKASDGGAAGQEPATFEGFPVAKGIQLCALIEPIQAVKNLGGKDKPLGDLMLVVAYDPDGKLSIVINLPENFGIEGERVSVNHFGMGVEISSSPRIMLNAHVAIKMEKQDDLVLSTTMAGTMTGAEGSFSTLTPWKNPFNVSDQVVIENIKGSMGIEYATVAATGPSSFALGGSVRAGKVRFGGALSIGQRPDQQLLMANLEGLDVGELIQFAGEIADSSTLKELRCEGDLRFEKAHMYFSTGATIHKTKYEAGMSASGHMVLFGKHAAFSASVGKTGLELSAAVDNFKIGPLEVRSASGGDQASFEFAMTTSKQLIKVDGQISLYGLSVVCLTEISVQPLKFDVFIKVVFTDQLTFKLRAKADEVKSLKDLADGDFMFELDVNVDVVGMLADAIIAVVDEIRKAGLEGFDNLDRLLQSELDDSAAELRKAEQAFENEKHKVAERKQAIEDNIKKWQAEQQATREKIDSLNADVEQNQAELKRRNDAAEAELQRVKNEQQARRDEEKTEWNQNKEKTQRDLDNLYRQQEKETELSRTIFAPLERAVNEKKGVVETLERNYYKFKKIADDAEWEFDRLPGWKKTYMSFKVGYHKADQGSTWLAWKGAEKGLEGLEALLETPECKRIRNMLDGLSTKIKNSTKYLDKLSDDNLKAILQEMTSDGEAKIEAARARRDAAIKANISLKKTIEDAITVLDQEKPELEQTISELQRKIDDSEDDKTLKILEANMVATKIEQQARQDRNDKVKAALKTVRQGFDDGTTVVSDALKFIKHNTFRITRVYITADTKAMEGGKGMTFSVTAFIAGQEVTRVIEWNPAQSAAEWYKTAAKALLH
ncbi:hypothetical protein B0I35DRAFT_464926 [Stachybotrys elegans]|uniref:Uncharacterized protein n=1 Tax=Stachybotrys elegans TaxID=80388 RepID=A0A8K0SB55_9HYPO|nr:hypothetical protein B0I35DRAFT_464926 [Stachybotrys elegans]